MLKPVHFSAFHSYQEHSTSWLLSVYSGGVIHNFLIGSVPISEVSLEARLQMRRKIQVRPPIRHPVTLPLTGGNDNIFAWANEDWSGDAPSWHCILLFGDRGKCEWTTCQSFLAECATDESAYKMLCKSNGWRIPRNIRITCGLCGVVVERSLEAQKVASSNLGQSASR